MEEATTARGDRQGSTDMLSEQMVKVQAECLEVSGLAVGEVAHESLLSSMRE